MCQIVHNPTNVICMSNIIRQIHMLLGFVIDIQHNLYEILIFINYLQTFKVVFRDVYEYFIKKNHV